MEFREELPRARKARGWSQEDLAARVGVSRQAVSKWETGDAAPDLQKLVALADALDMSLDTLCGREPPAPAAADTADPPAVLRAARGGKTRRAWLALCVLLAVCMAAGGMWWNGSRRSIVPAEDLTVFGYGFSSMGGSKLGFYFTPSVASEHYTYRVIFTDQEGGSATAEVPCVDGLCSGTVALDQSDVYSVTVSVSGGNRTVSIPVVSDLRFSNLGISWFPLV